MGVQHLLIEAIACACPNEPRRFLCPTGRILLPVPGRGKLVLIRPPVLLRLLLPLGGAVEDMFAQSPDPYPPLWGSRCSLALHKLPPRLYSFLRLTATHWPLAPKETTWPGQEGRAASDTWETRTSLPRISQTPVLSQLILSDPLSPLSGIVGQVFGVFSAQWAIPVSKTNTEHGGFLVPMQIYLPKPQRSALQAEKSKRGLWQPRAIPVTLPQDHRGHLALFGE